VALDQLRPGDCVNGVKEGARVISLTAVPCAEPHEGEVFAKFELPAGPFPGDSAVAQQSNDGCFDRLAPYAARAVDDQDLQVFYYAPERRSWSQGRGVLCLAVHTQRTTGSIRT
jgi:Septum formation